MDIASLIGIIGTLGMIAGAMISSGGLGMFVDTPSISVKTPSLVTMLIKDSIIVMF